MKHTSTKRGLTLDHVWIVAAVALLVIGPLLAPVPPNDLWFHIATGRLTAITGMIPSADTCSYTRGGALFYNQGWLAQLFLYLVHQAGGVPLLLVIHALTILLAYGLLLRLCIRRTGNVRLSVVLFLVALPVAFPSWNIRPQTFAFPLFAGFLYVLTAYRLGWNNRLWLLPLLMILWVNVHGTFVLGLVLIGVVAAGMVVTRFQGVGEAQLGRDGSAGWLRSFAFGRWSLVVWGALTALATLINPRGVGVLGYVRNLVGNNAVTSLVTEWAPPTVRATEGMVFFVFLLVGVLLMVYGRRRPDLTDMLLFLPFLWLALGASRNVVWFVFVALPILVVQAGSLIPAPKRTPAGLPIMNALLVGMLAMGVLVLLPWVKPLWLLPPQGDLLKNTPVEAVAFLTAQADRPRHLFHTEAHGSYLTWAAPDQPVFIDPRIELYPYEQWSDYMNLSAANNTDALIQKYDLDGMLLSKEMQLPLINALRADTAWQQRYEDNLVVYFTRS